MRIFERRDQASYEHPIIGVLALLFLAELLFVGWSASHPAASNPFPVSEVAGESVALSGISGPSIGSDAASIVLCQSLPLQMWVFLLAAFVLLLAYNLGAALRDERLGRSGPSWIFELLLMLVTLLAWYAWDGCRSYPWFPFATVKFGLILYAGYLFFRTEAGAPREPEQKAALF